MHLETKNFVNTNLMEDNDNSIVLPSNIEAEKAILGAFLNNNEYMNQVGDFLRAEHFFVPIHKKIFEAILKLSEKGLIASPITLKNYFQSDEVFNELNISSLEYLLKLSSMAATIINIVPYAKDVYNNYIRRKMIQISEEALKEAYTSDVNITAQDIIERTEHRIFNLASNSDIESSTVSLRNSLIESIKKIDLAKREGGKISGVETGFRDLDTILGGMQRSDLIILAARPSMGKTALAVNIAINSALSFFKKKEISEKKSVAIFSLEMSSEQLTNRIISSRTGIDANKIRTGNISKAEFEELSKSSLELSDIPIFIDDTPAITISALRTRARRLKRQHNLGLIVVDYLQLLRGTAINSSQQNRVQEIGEISQGLKAIAKELDIPVIALSQLSRAVETREDKRPQLSDLRESGNIEQDADIVMFIYRDEYYMARKMPNGTDKQKYDEWQAEMAKVKNIAEILIAKQRNGPVGNVSLMFDSKTTAFKDLDTMHSMVIIT